MCQRGLFLANNAAANLIDGIGPAEPSLGVGFGGLRRHGSHFILDYGGGLFRSGFDYFATTAGGATGRFTTCSGAATLAGKQVVEQPE